MSRRTAESNKAILSAWNKEQELVQKGKGTREWTPQQQQDILDKGKAYDEDGVAFQGQHMKSAEQYPEYQGDPNNIQFLTRAEHLEAHNGNWRNPTNWYFNPVTKEKINFGDGPFIPCKVIQLAEPLIVSETTNNKNEPVVQENIKEKPPEVKHSSLDREIPKLAPHQQNNTANQPKLGFFEKAKAVFDKVGKVVVEFLVKHPTATGIGIAVLSGAAAALKSSSSDSGDGYSEHNGNSGYIPDEFGDLYDDFSSSDDIPNESDTTYTPNDVPAGKQRYHYKDGSVRWKDKPPYHRSGNSDE